MAAIWPAAPPKDVKPISVQTFAASAKATSGMPLPAARLICGAPARRVWRFDMMAARSLP